MSKKIMLNDLFFIEDIDRVKIRFLMPYKFEDPIELFKYKKPQLLNWQFWNYNKKKSFKEGEMSVGFVKIDKDKWLLFDVSRVLKDLNIFNGVGYEYEKIEKYEKFFGRLIIRYKNKSQNLVRNASSVINQCEVVQILEDSFNDDIFPGYENVNISWNNLEKVIHNNSWKTALENQKGVYLITDKTNGKKYVGSAYGETMLYGRWLQYMKDGHGGNVELKLITKDSGFDYIKNNFYYSILEIYKAITDDSVILKRESLWKDKLFSKKFGYNSN